MDFGELRGDGDGHIKLGAGFGFCVERPPGFSGDPDQAFTAVLKRGVKERRIWWKFGRPVFVSAGFDTVEFQALPPGGPYLYALFEAPQDWVSGREAGQAGGGSSSAPQQATLVDAAAHPGQEDVPTDGAGVLLPAWCRQLRLLVTVQGEMPIAEGSFWGYVQLADGEPWFRAPSLDVSAGGEQSLAFAGPSLVWLGPARIAHRASEVSDQLGEGVTTQLTYLVGG